MQPSSRVVPRMILFGEKPIGDKAEAFVTVRLPSEDWAIDHFETDDADTAVAREGTDTDGGIRFRVTQRIGQIGDHRSSVRVIIRKADRQMEAVMVDVQYYGQKAAAAKEQ
jgi:hypothetical protein